MGAICPGGICLGGKCPGGYMSGGKCPGGTCPGGVFVLSPSRFRQRETDSQEHFRTAVTFELLLAQVDGGSILVKKWLKKTIKH